MYSVQHLGCHLQWLTINYQFSIVDDEILTSDILGPEPINECICDYELPAIVFFECDKCKILIQNQTFLH